MPNPVLAERVCAYVICHPDAWLTFDEMIDFLKTKRMAAWKLPERLEIRQEFPMTPSGKIQKYRLRAEIAALVGHKALVR
jgi:non-ribosomal peptide synthetase component E (peptide arylation enzyme)